MALTLVSIGEPIEDWATIARRRADQRARAKRFYGRLTAAQTYLNGMRIRARMRGVPCTLTVSEVAAMLRQTRVCPILRIRLRIGGQHIGESITNNLATFDSFDPALGYVPGNVAVISHRANRLKNNATMAEIKALYLWMKRQQRS